MGTSKGYIAPTTSHWSTAKRAVTAFINNRDFDSKAKAASKYATAMKTDMSTGGSFQSAAGVYISCKRIYPETKYLKFALGFHPQDVSLKDADFYDFMQLVNTTNYVGEIGLDFSRQSYISRNKQCMYFEQIVRVCAEKDKLMSVHLRRAEEEAISILKKYRPRRCIIHWFNGNGEQLQQLVDIGCYFSLNSNMVTNEKNKEKLYLIPKTRVLIESDGPFTKIDGKKYTFNNLIKIYELVARYYNEPDIIKMVYANFRDILSK